LLKIKLPLDARSRDTLRREAAPTLKALKQSGVEHTIMLTGDNKYSASAIAQEIGLTEFAADSCLKIN